MQQQSPRSSAFGQWFDDEESMTELVRRQYRAVQRPDESDKESFKLYSDIGSLLSRGKSHEAGVLLTRLEKRLAASAVARDEGANEEEPARPDERAMNWVSAKSADEGDQEPNWVTSNIAEEPAWVTSGLDKKPPAKAASPKQANRADAKPSLAVADLGRHKASGVDLEKLLKEVRIKPVVVDEKEVGPMGYAQSDYGACDFPRVEVGQGPDGKFRVKPTSAMHDASGHTCQLTDVGNRLLGVISSVDEKTGMLSLKGGGARFVRNGAKKEWVGCDLRRGVDKAARRDIEAREFEHLLDFAYAFLLATEATVKVVNKLSGTPYDSADDALRALTIEHEHKQLIPLDYRNPDAWADRARVVAETLALESKTRDTAGHHSPIFEAVRDGSVVTLRPVFKADSFLSSELMKLNTVPVVFTGLKETKAVKAGAKMKLSGKVIADLCDKPDGADLGKRWLEAGLAVTIGPPGKEGKVWACALAIDIDPNNDKFRDPAAALPKQVHFLVSTEFL